MHFIFPPGAVTEPTEVTCSLWNSKLRAPILAENEALVSNVIELSPVDLKLADHVTIALPYSSTELEGYEVVVKQLTNQINNTWEEIETIDIKDESGTAISSFTLR